MRFIHRVFRCEVIDLRNTVSKTTRRARNHSVEFIPHPKLTNIDMSQYGCYVTPRGTRTCTPWRATA